MKRIVFVSATPSYFLSFVDLFKGLLETDDPLPAIHPERAIGDGIRRGFVVFFHWRKGFFVSRGAVHNFNGNEA